MLAVLLFKLQRAVQIDTEFISRVPIGYPTDGGR